MDPRDAAMSPLARRARAFLTARLTLARDYGVVALSVALFVALSVTSDVFLTDRNLLNILAQNAPLAIVAAAGTLVIIAGGFDLSVGAIASMAGVVAAKLALSTGSAALGLVAAVVAGGALGLMNGLVVNYLQVNAIVATIATGIIISGLAQRITGGAFVSVADPTFQWLGREELAGVKWSIVACVAFCGVLQLALARAVFGRYVYAVGGNAEAARFSGIPIRRISTHTYVISGIGGGLAGAILASRVGSASANAAPGIEFAALVAIVIGGTSILGGEGAVWRTVVGVLFLALIANGFILLSIPAEYRRIIEGVILLSAIAFDVWVRKRPA